MKRRISTALIMSLVAFSLFAQTEESITLKTETADIKGTLLLPEAEKAIPVVLIIAGSGPTDRNGNNPMMKNNSLKMLAEGLASNNIASLRYDKRGIAESVVPDLNELDLSFENYVEDAEGWIELLKKDKRFKKVIVIGHSEGSLIGMIAANRQKANKFVSIAGVGQPADLTIREQLEAQPPLILEQAAPILDSLVKGETVEEVPPLLFSLFRKSIQPYLISWFKYDPQKEIAKLKIPVLIIQGTTDIQVTVKDADRLTEAAKKAEKHIIEGMNHILKESVIDRMENIKTYNDPELPLKDGLVKAIVEFVK